MAARSSAARSLHKLGLALLFAAAVVVPGHAREVTPEPESATVALGDLPPQARQTEQLIRAGGPFPYARDGTVFGNRERLLPRQARGFYREYTVKTPGVRDRGARRIVCGGRAASAPQTCYYSADHYASFRRIAR